MLEINFLNVLYIGSDKMGQQSFHHILSQSALKMDFHSVLNLPQAYQELEKKTFQIIFCELNLSEGVVDDLLTSKQVNGTPVVVISAETDKHRGIDLLKKGAYNFILNEDITTSGLEEIIKSAHPQIAIQQETSQLDSGDKFADLDLGLLPQIADGDEEFIITLLETYIKNTTIDINNYEASMSNLDIQYDIAHKLRPTFELFGFTKMQEVSTKIELKTASDEERLSFFQDLKESIGIVQDKLQKFQA